LGIRQFAGRFAALLALTGCLFAAPSAAAEDTYGRIIANDMKNCAPGSGPSVRVTITGVKSSTGLLRMQLYRATKADWLEKGRWLNRIEVPARKGRMTFCMPVPENGEFAIAARHDANDNNETDIFKDGGAMSNNPSINIFNLGRPSVDQTRFQVKPGFNAITIRMLYL
jgi:uncharacterized protein (DUF2141 family)